MDFNSKTFVSTAPVGMTHGTFNEEFCYFSTTEQHTWHTIPYFTP